MYNLPEITESAQRLDRLVRKERDAQVQRRLHMLLLLKTEGQKPKRSGPASRRSSQHDCQLAQPLRRGRNREASTDRGARTGARPAVDSSGGDGAAERAARRARGLCQLQSDSTVTCRRAWDQASVFDGSSDCAIRAWGQAEGASTKPPKKSECQQVAFQEELPARIETIRVEADRPVRLFCQDESRFGLMPITRCRITLPGVGPIQQHQPAYESFYLYGAVEPVSGERFLLERSSLNSEVSTATAFRTFSTRFRGGSPRASAFWCWTTGGFTRPKSSRFQKTFG